MLCLLFPDNPQVVITVLFFYVFKILENKNCNRSDKTLFCERWKKRMLKGASTGPATS